MTRSPSPPTLPKALPQGRATAVARRAHLGLLFLAGGGAIIKELLPFPTAPGRVKLNPALLPALTAKFFFLIIIIFYF